VSADLQAMFAIFYIAKRNIQDILRTGVFWVAVGLAGFICFSMLYWGWRQIEPHVSNQQVRHAPFAQDMTDPDNPRHPRGFEDQSNDWDPLASIKPENIILLYAYGITIFFANLLAIFIMMGLIGRELDRRTIDLLVSRPVSRSQILTGKLLAGWASIVIFMALMAIWTIVCQMWGGMGLKAGYLNACAIGTVAPLLVGAITLVLSIWMRGFLAGLLSVVMTSAAGTTGMILIKLLGIEVLKLKWPVWFLYKILPPMNVIGEAAVEHLQSDLWLRYARGMFEGIGPVAADGIYSEMWHVWVYLGVVLIVGWLSFFRREFT
jgi:ABC-type transport system involved in multi-copper enzyme maturation permease subunit